MGILRCWRTFLNVDGYCSMLLPPWKSQAGPLHWSSSFFFIFEPFAQVGKRDFLTSSYIHFQFTQSWSIRIHGVWGQWEAQGFDFLKTIATATQCKRVTAYHGTWSWSSSSWVETHSERPGKMHAEIFVSDSSNLGSVFFSLLLLEQGKNTTADTCRGCKHLVLYFPTAFHSKWDSPLHYLAKWRRYT